MFYHFFPWTILVLLLFRKGVIKMIRENPFLSYNVLIIFFNIIPYWTSPEVHPRYLLMLLPLIYTLLGWLYLKYREESHSLARTVDVIFFILVIGVTLGSWAPLFIAPVNQFQMMWLVCILIFITLTIITVLYWRQVRYRLYWIAIVMLVLRIGFDLTVMPARHHLDTQVKVRELGKDIGRESIGTPLYIWWNPEKEEDPYYGKKRLDYPYMYYISTGRDGMITYSSEMEEGAYYMAVPDEIEGMPYIKVRDITPYDERKPRWLVRFEN
jgi:hypothetical protein